MRRNRLIAAGFAAAVTLGLLAVAQPGNANTETTTPQTTTDNKIAADTDVVIFAVQSRAPNIDDEEVDGNALSIFNAGTMTVNLLDWEVEVQDSGGNITAFHLFGNIDLLAKQHYILHTTGFVVNPIDGQAQRAPFGSQNQTGTDEIPQVYEVTVTSDTPAQIDRVASSSTGTTPEGNPAPQLTAATDQFNAFVRRDVLGTDLENNAFDFAKIGRAHV